MAATTSPARSTSSRRCSRQRVARRCWDHRGHGDSDRPALASWDADVRDALAVLESTTDQPVPVMGHSKGGGIVLQLAEAVPHRVTKIVNIDGLPSQWPRPDVSDHERSRMMAAEIARWLERRRSLGRGERKPGTIDELAARRARMNPRLRWTGSVTS